MNKEIILLSNKSPLKQTCNLSRKIFKIMFTTIEERDYFQLTLFHFQTLQLNFICFMLSFLLQSASPMKCKSTCGYLFDATVSMKLKMPKSYGPL